MKINTTRFGELEVEKKDIISFKEGLLGFEHLKRFFIVDPGDQTLILWLQSIDNPATAFPIIEPKIFNPDYIVKLLPAELNSLKLENLNDTSIYTILTIPQIVTEMSANGGTAMYDGIAVALSMLAEKKRQVPEGKPLLVVLTDGETNEGLGLSKVEKTIREYLDSME